MIFELRNGSFAYNKKDYIFKDISFTIKSGEILTILGRNGIGKTTLVKCISRYTAVARRQHIHKIIN